MRCVCCDKELSDYEATLRGAHTGHFLDTCLDCISSAEISYMSLSSQVPQEEPCCIEYNSYEEDCEDSYEL